MHKLETQLADAEVTIEFEDEREEELYRQAALGEDAREWLLTPLGTAVLKSARADQREIERKLTEVKPNTPWRRRKIRELQTEHEAIRRAIGWLSDQINQGRMAMDQLQAEREE